MPAAGTAALILKKKGRNSYRITSIHLQEEVDARTEELRKASDELSELNRQFEEDTEALVEELKSVD